MNLADNNFASFLASELLKTEGDFSNIVNEKRSKAKKIGKILAGVPGVTSVILCNNLGFGLANEESDLDFLILTRQGQIWISRFFAMLATKLFGYRISGADKKDKACLSFFLAPSGYDLGKIAIEDDVYLKNWLAALKCISGFAEFSRFIEANIIVRQNGFLAQSALNDGNGWSLPWPWLERFLEKIQRRHFNYQKKILLDAGGTEVIASESMLKFHVNDRRRYYRELYNLTMKKQ